MVLCEKIQGQHIKMYAPVNQKLYQNINIKIPGMLKYFV